MTAPPKICEVLSCKTPLSGRQRTLCLAHKDQHPHPSWPHERTDVPTAFVTETDPRYEELLRTFPDCVAQAQPDGTWKFGPRVAGMGLYEFLAGELALRRIHFEHEVYLIASPPLDAITPTLTSYLGAEARPGVRLYNVGVSSAKASLARKRWLGHVASYRKGTYYGAEVMLEAMESNGVKLDFLTHVSLVEHVPASPDAGIKARALELETLRGPTPTPDGAWCQHEGKQPPPTFHQEHLRSSWGKLMAAAHPDHTVDDWGAPDNLHTQGIDPAKDVAEGFPHRPPTRGSLYPLPLGAVAHSP